jgi:hypothetical protein
MGIDMAMWDFQVPVIAIFTKYDQFRRDIKMKLQDEGRDPEMDLDAEVEKRFKQHYLAGLKGSPRFIRLESEDHGAVNDDTCCIDIHPIEMQKHGQRCADLIEMTAKALSVGAVAIMLVAVQRDNLELSIKQAIIW